MCGMSVYPEGVAYPLFLHQAQSDVLCAVGWVRASCVVILCTRKTASARAVWLQSVCCGCVLACFDISCLGLKVLLYYWMSRCPVMCDFDVFFSVPVGLLFVSPYKDLSSSVWCACRRVEEAQYLAPLIGRDQPLRVSICTACIRENLRADTLHLCGSPLKLALESTVMAEALLRVDLPHAVGDTPQTGREEKQPCFSRVRCPLCSLVQLRTFQGEAAD